MCLRALTAGTLCLGGVKSYRNNFCLGDQIFLFKCRTQYDQVVRNMNRVKKTGTSLESKNDAFAVLLGVFSEADKTISHFFFFLNYSFWKGGLVSLPQAE